ncbi:Importin subunit beta-2 [Paramyrothecium foliicola]|nr:Importin subunit beta-2 [Paramyrothecium foliicola]
MAWQPATDSLNQLAACLKDSLSGFDKAAQKQAELMLQQAKSSPDINNYLAYIFSSAGPPQGLQCSEQDYHLVRSAAGIMLKNNVKSEWKDIPTASLDLIKLAIPMGLQDKNSQIRNFAGNIATEVIRRGGLLGWPGLLPQLIEMMSDTNGQVSDEGKEGAMSAMAKICEDNFRMLMKEVNGERPLNYVLPHLIAATKSPLPRVRSGALTAINVFTPRESQAMLNSIDDLLQHLFVLANDPSTDVRRQVCRAFVHLVETRPDKLQPHISGLVEYIITQQKCDDEELACEAAEFWLAVGEHDNLWKALEPYINRIIPVLLDCMVYSGEDIALLGGLSDDEEEEDREEDIKPAFAKKNLTRTANGEALESAEGKNGEYEKLMDDGLEDGEVEDYEDAEDGDADEKWTIRKCSAAALDVFARDFRGPVFAAILPYLSQNIKHEEWPHREAAVLALGAVAEGCMDVVIPHLKDLVPYLISLLEDQEPVVRQITCWTLGRYSSWAANLTDPNDVNAFFVPMMDGILRKMLDKNKKVQEAGASAFANLEEKAGKALEPYCGPIIQQFVRCFAKYKDRNMYILYDCVQTLAERLGSALANPDLTNQLMPALNDRYNSISDNTRELFPLLECLSYVALALGDAFTPYAAPIFVRCVNIIHNSLEQALNAASNPSADQPDKDFLITSLDLLSAIIQALEGGKAGELIKASPHPFFELLSFCMEDPADDVRQSAYALLGDCARYVFPQLQPYLPTIFPILLKQLDLDNILDEEMDSGFGVVNNACWSAGEIALQNGTALAQWADELLQRFVEVMSNPRVPKGLSENAAIALGRLGTDNAQRLAPDLSKYADEFLTAMHDVEWNEEKATAFKGFTAIIGKNPEAMGNYLLKFFTVIARYRDTGLRSPLKEELHNNFQQVLTHYKSIMQSFDSFVGSLSPRDQQSLRNTEVWMWNMKRERVELHVLHEDGPVFVNITNTSAAPQMMELSEVIERSTEEAAAYVGQISATAAAFLHNGTESRGFAFADPRLSIFDKPAMIRLLVQGFLSKRDDQGWLRDESSTVLG